MGRIVKFAMVAALAPLWVAAAYATQADLDTIREQCGIQLKMSASACDCLVKRAEKLNDKQQAFVAAVVMKDKAKRTEIQGTMTINEMTEAGMFMTSAPVECRGQ